MLSFPREWRTKNNNQRYFWGKQMIKGFRKLNTLSLRKEDIIWGLVTGSIGTFLTKILPHTYATSACMLLAIQTMFLRKHLGHRR